MGSAVERTDEHVREYLIYRGFTSTLKQLDGEIKADKEKGLRVDKIMEQLQQLVQAFDLNGLKQYWLYLDRRLFSRLEDVYRCTVSKLRTSLFRYYVVSSIQRGNPERTQEFFQRQGAELQGQAEWRDWFSLAFLPNPEQHPTFAPYFSRQWADTFLVSLHNFLSVLFQCMPQPVLLSFDAEVQRMTGLSEDNEELRQQLFALQTETRDQQRDQQRDQLVLHKLPSYVQHMDRLGDTELELVSSQRAAAATANANAPPRNNFFSSFLPQGRRLPPGGKPRPPSPGRREEQPAKIQAKVEAAISQQPPGQGQAGSQPANQTTRHRRVQDHEKERKELLAKPRPQTPERRGGDPPPSSPSSPPSDLGDPSDPAPPPPFIKLSQEEFGEHHSSIMHCRVDSSGRRVASLDVDGVIKVWSFNPMMQTKATIMSKSPLLSLEWAAKPERLLLLGSGVGTVRLYDTDAKKNLYEMSIDDAHPRILSLACSPSGSSFVCSAAALTRPPGGGASQLQGGGASSVPGQLLLWDTKTVKQQLQFSLEPEPVAVNCTAFNHNGNLLVTGAADGVIRLFDMQRYDSAMSWKAHDGEVYSVEFSYDENTVFSIGEDGKLIQWNIHRCGGKQSETLLPPDATGPFVLSGYSGYKQVQVPRGRLFAFDSEGRHILTCSGSGGLIYRVTNGEPALERVLALGGHRAPVVTVDWCSALDCGTCLTASMDGRVQLSTLLAQ
ncbi:WD repeat-containing protein 91 [Cololabis saira]|uniref:WD repeat-containing protein 91 n=1 Tax=Cololabis saira TaxID=129043 RepID=UPI002AD31171|nr:WD repeat-containing protein 91 [Cololabis saira]